MNMTLKLVPLIALAVMPAAASAQVIAGRVVEAANANPLANVEVRVEADGRTIGSVVTDTTGRFSIRANAGGTFRLTTRHIAFAPLSADVEVGAGAMVELLLKLSVQPTELPAIEVVARGRAPDPLLERTGFYDRRNGGFGVFKTPEDIERRNAFSATDHFQGIGGVRVYHTGGLRGKDIRMSRGEDSNCSPRIRIDNVIARRGGRYSSPADPPLDALINPQDILAIEIYRGPTETPPEYGGNDVTCGVVVIWTKRGSGGL
jgi:hypothetical protein